MKVKSKNCSELIYPVYKTYRFMYWVLVIAVAVAYYSLTFKHNATVGFIVAVIFWVAQLYTAGGAILVAYWLYVGYQQPRYWFRILLGCISLYTAIGIGFIYLLHYDQLIVYSCNVYFNWLVWGAQLYVFTLISHQYYLKSTLLYFVTSALSYYLLFDFAYTKL